MGWIGGGDAKLAAATALWFGFDHLLDYLLYASLFGGALTLVLLQFRQWPLPSPLAAALAANACTAGERHSLRHRARDRRADDLSGHRVDAGARSTQDPARHARRCGPTDRAVNRYINSI